MLYKKVHRQYLKEWRLGRKFKYLGSNDEVVVRKVTYEPTIVDSYICVNGVDLISFSSGKIRYKDVFIWLD